MRTVARRASAPGSPASRINEASRRAERHRPTVELAPIVDLLPVDHPGSATMAPPVGPEHAAARAEIRRVLEQAVDTLPTPFRVVFMMRVVEQLSIEETAAALAIPAATVKTRLHRANGQLRAVLGGTFAAILEDTCPFGGMRCARLTDAVLTRLPRDGPTVPRRDRNFPPSCYAAPWLPRLCFVWPACRLRLRRPTHAPPPAPFRKVSELVKLPDFLPGTGTLYVDPKTLPEGPFLAYDQTGRLVSTIYMVPLAPLSRLATPVTPPPEVMEPDRRQRWATGSLSGFLLRHGHHYNRPAWTLMHRRWLAGLRFEHAVHHIVLEDCIAAVEAATARRDHLEAHIAAALPDWSLAMVVHALQALRGMALVAAATLVAELGDIKLQARIFLACPPSCSVPALFLPLLVGGAAATLSTIACITAAQKTNDADWRRQDLGSLSGGVLADGLGTIVAGLLGGIGQSASAASVGLGASTRATSRIVAYAVAFLLLLPKFAMLVVLLPKISWQPSIRGHDCYRKFAACLQR